MVLSRVTQFSEEFLASPAEIVVPRPLRMFGGEPLNPLTIAPDWTTEIEMTTSWRTDLSRADGLDVEEAVGYLTRPARSMTCSITGRSNEETHVLSQILLGYATANAPAPIYCDAATIVDYSVDTGVDPNQIIVYGDFSHGHYFIGQRVVILSTDIVKSRGENKAQWLQIVETGNDWLRLSGVPARLPTRKIDFIVPCMDADMVESASGSFLTDGILRAQVTWNESSGPETLPASFPPMAFNNLSPFVGYTEEGLPIFDFRVNWASGLDVEVSRTIRSTPQGRSTIQAASGGAFLTFNVNMLATSRKVAWDHLRFFDGCRGRAGIFVYIHPNPAWKLYTPFPFNSTTLVNIYAIGSRGAISDNFRYVALTKNDGRVFLRRIVGVTNVADVNYRIELETPLPDTTGYIKIAPAHISRLGKDSITQAWKNDGVNTTEFEIKECLTNTEATIPAGQAAIELEAQREYSTITARDPDVWLHPASHTFAFNPKSGTLQPTAPWPAEQFAANRVYDPRELVGSNAELNFRPKRPWGHARQAGNAILQYPQPFQNKGKSFVRNGEYAISSLTPATLAVNGTPNPITWPHLWSNTTGWTLIISLTPFDSTNSAWPYVQGENMRVMGTWVGTPNAPLFVLFTSHMNAANDCGIAWKDNNAISRQVQFTGVQFRQTSRTNLLVVRFDPTTGRLHAHVNGVNGIAGGFFSTTGFYITDTYVEAVFGSAFNYGTFTNYSANMNTWGNLGAINAVLSFQRALTSLDVNEVCFELTEAYGGLWTPISY